jgi:hypothetical protein
VIPVSRVSMVYLEIKVWLAVPELLESKATVEQMDYLVLLDLMGVLDFLGPLEMMDCPACQAVLEHQFLEKLACLVFLGGMDFPACQG